MKKTTLFLMLAFSSNMLIAQIDMYDITTHENVNVKKNINQNIHVGGAIYENKTITTIDYGALAEANANMQRLQFEKQRYADERQKQIALEMAANPLKAYDYGHNLTMTVEKKVAAVYGFKNYSYTYRIPHKDFFYEAGEDILENISANGVKTEIIIYAPFYNIYNQKIVDKPDISFIIEDTVNNVGPSGEPVYVYKKALVKSMVFGHTGYKMTIIWEDDYQYCITDNYQSHLYDGNGISFFVKVRTYCSKEDADFEQLEGRRYYLRPLIEKIISTAKINEGYKVGKTKKLEEKGNAR